MSNEIDPQSNDEVLDEIIDLDATQADEEGGQEFDMSNAQIVHADGRSEPYVKPEAPKQEPKEDAPEFVVPDKYKGKGVNDLIELLQQQDREISRRGNEIHELRQVSQSIVERELDRSPKQEQAQSTEIDVDSLLENPNAAINKLLENNPTLRKMQEKLEKANREAEEAAFVKKHPNYVEVVNSQHFVDWVKASPVRLKLFHTAHSEYDYALGAELLDTYNKIHSIAKAGAEAKREADLRAIEGTGAGKDASSGKKRRVLYKKDQIMKIMQTDPAKYERMLQGDLQKAFAEGRVLD